MAKFSGKIGFVKDVETPEGSDVWVEKAIEKHYRGDVVNDVTRWQDSSKVNEELNVGDKISIVADTFAKENIGCMRYVEYLGAKWKITTIDTTYYPRITLYLGGLYNGTTSN